MGGYYDQLELTPKLKKYKANVMGNEGTFENQAGTIGTTVDNANLKFKTASDTVGATCKDPQGNTAVAMLGLVSQASSRMHDSVINDVGAICAQCRLIDPQIEQIEKDMQTANNIPRDRLVVEAWDEFQRKVFTGSHNGSNYGRYCAIRDRVKHDMQQLEAHIASIAQSSYNIDLGITAASLASGALGPYTSFSDTFSFTKQQWEDENPMVSLTIWQEAGCAVVGAVESVVKVVEGVADAALTVVGGVVSLFTGNDDNWFRRAAQYDVAGTLGKGMASVIGVDAKAYEASIGRKIGNFTGSVVAHGVLWATGVGAVISAVSIAGNSMERNLQDGKTIGEALWRGTLDGAISYVGGRVLQSVGSKIMPKITNWVKSSNNILARTIKAGATSFKDWGSLSLGGKVVSAVVSPLRGYIKGVGSAIKTGAKWLSPKFTALGEHSKIFKKVIDADAAFAAKVDRGVDRAFEAVKNAKAAVSSKVHSATDKLKNSKLGQKVSDVKAKVSDTASKVKNSVKSAASKAKAKITGKTGAETAATSDTGSAVKKGASPAGDTGAKTAKVGTEGGAKPTGTESGAKPTGTESGAKPTGTETGAKPTGTTAEGAGSGSPSPGGDGGGATARKVPTAETLTADDLDEAFRINSPDSGATQAEHEWANKVLDVADDATRPATQMGAADGKLNQHAPADITGAPDAAHPSESAFAQNEGGIHQSSGGMSQSAGGTKGSLERTSQLYSEAVAKGDTAAAARYKASMAEQMKTLAGDPSYQSFNKVGTETKAFGTEWNGGNATTNAANPANRAPRTAAQSMFNTAEPATTSSTATLSTGSPSTSAATSSAAAPAGGTPPSGGSKIPGYEPRITGADNVGMPGLSPDAPKMTYSQAEAEIKMLTQDMGFNPQNWDPLDPLELEMAGRYHDALATMANTVPGNADVVLKQGGNWYQNAENMAKVAGYDFLANGNNAAWGDYTDSIYTLGRIPGNGYTTPPPGQPPIQPPVNPPITPQPPKGGSKAGYVFNPGPVIGAVEDKKQQGHRQEVGTQGNS